MRIIKQVMLGHKIITWGDQGFFHCWMCYEGILSPEYTGFGRLDLDSLRKRLAWLLVCMWPDEVSLRDTFRHSHPVCLCFILNAPVNRASMHSLWERNERKIKLGE